MSYRRDDTAALAGRINDHFVSRFGKRAVFFDVDSISPSQDFVQVIIDSVGRCNALIVVIGPQWLNYTNKNQRRIDDPTDFVRIEVETALELGIPVFPVLADQCKMPSADDLPVSIRKLAQLQAVEVSNGRFGSDVDRLLRALGHQGFSRRRRGVAYYFMLGGGAVAVLAVFLILWISTGLQLGNQSTGGLPANNASSLSATKASSDPDIASRVSPRVADPDHCELCVQIEGLESELKSTPYSEGGDYGILVGAADGIISDALKPGVLNDYAAGLLAGMMIHISGYDQPAQILQDNSSTIFAAYTAKDSPLRRAVAKLTPAERKAFKSYYNAGN
jgi:hypothetical protein